jgi:hypothetical protein
MKVAFIASMQSGKTTALEYFIQLNTLYKRKSICIKFANPLYEAQYCFLPNGTKNRLFLQELSDLVKKHFGPEILNQKFIEKDNKNKIDVFCDDVRTSSEFEIVKQQGFLTIGIMASENIRKVRNPQLFIGINHITEIEINNLLPLCDYLIQNESSKESFFKQCMKIYQENFQPQT